MSRVHVTRARAAAVAVALVAGLAIPAAATAASRASTPRAHAAHAAAKQVKVPGYNHIAVIMFTDHGYTNIIGNKNAPTFNKLAKEYGVASEYFTTSDPDTAGIMAFLAGNSYNINDGEPYWDQRVNKPSLLSQLDKAHKSWKEYVQDIPYAGYLGDCYPTVCLETDTLYKQEKFNPVPDLVSVADNPAEARKMVPASELASDAKRGRLPNFSFIDANECTNMHGGPPWCIDSPNNLGQLDDNQLVSDGDGYLKQVVSEITSGPQWKHGNNAIVVTETEGITSAGCCDANPGTGRVLTIVITNHRRHLVDSTKFNSYSLLATVEHAFGLGCLQFACDTKNVLPMARLFGAKSDGREGFGKHAAAVVASLRIPAKAQVAKLATPSVKPSVTSPWQVVSSPNTGTNDNDLWSVAGRNPGDIWAVGSLLPNANATIVQTLALHYDGSTWTRVPTANVGKQANYLYGLAVLPDGTAWATGTYTVAAGHTDKALTEHWANGKWTAIPAANPGSAEDMLYGATAVSDDDVWAVGTAGDSEGFFHPLIEHWNGGRWTAVGIKGLSKNADGILFSATSQGSQVWATGQLSSGSGDRQVLLHLVAGSWQVVKSPAVLAHGAAADAYPQSIALSASGVPWIAGRQRSGHNGYTTLLEAPGAGTSMVRLTTPNPTPQDNYLWGIAPVGADAWAVGTSIPASTGNANSLIEFGSPTGGWQVVPTPDPSTNGNNILDGVFAFSSTNVWAVGEYDGMGGMKTLIMHYTGGTP
jgi:phosphatidylinositol-3-phosphatase